MNEQFDPITGEKINVEEKTELENTEVTNTEVPTETEPIVTPEPEVQTEAEPNATPVEQPVVAPSQPNTYQMSMEEWEGKKKDQSKIIIAIAIAAVAVIAVLVILVVGFFSGAFLSNRNKILNATKNTFEDTGFLFNDLTEVGASIKDTCSVS